MSSSHTMRASTLSFFVDDDDANAAARRIATDMGAGEPALLA